MPSRLFFTSLVLGIIVCDQLTKWIVIEGLLKLAVDVPGTPLWAWLTTIPQKPFDFVLYKVTDFLNLVLVWNRGVNYFVPGDLQGPPWIMITLTGALALLLLVWMLKTPKTNLRWGLAAIVGGAFSNIWDRVRFGGVADFIDFHWGEWHWPAFNLADSLIVLGVAVILLDGLVLEPRKLRKKQKKVYDD